MNEKDLLEALYTQTLRLESQIKDNPEVEIPIWLAVTVCELAAIAAHVERAREQRIAREQS